MAEVAKIKLTTKWAFVEVVEYSSSGEVLAKWSLSTFNRQIVQAFFALTWLSADQLVGQKILFKGKFYNKDDRVFISLQELSSEFALWNMKATQSLIRKKLEEEGIFYNNKSTKFWFPPFKIAIISSNWAEWLQDFLSVCNKQNIPYSYTLIDTPVHGNNAKEWVYKALQEIYMDIQNGVEYNCICIIRWWWESSGMVWQNDIDIARGVCHIPIPVIIAIWHTTDVSVLQDIAYFYANTPTAAAQYILEQYNSYISKIDEILNSIQSLLEHKIQKTIFDVEILWGNINAEIEKNIARIWYEIKHTFWIVEKYHPDLILANGYAILRQQNTILHGIPPIGSRIEIETNSYFIGVTVDSVATKE